MTGGILSLVVVIAVFHPFCILRITGILEGNIAVHQHYLSPDIHVFIIVIVQFGGCGAISHPYHLCGHLAVA